MNRVSAGGQFLAEFGTDDAAAPVGWIDRDADVHKSGSLVFGLGSLAFLPSSLVAIS
jgi:hypothetical protein